MSTYNLNTVYTVMTRSQIVEWAQAQGYSYILTAAGPVPLDAWNPYGGATKDKLVFYPDPNWERNDMVRELPPPFGFYSGVWTLLR